MSMTLLDDRPGQFPRRSASVFADAKEIAERMHVSPNTVKQFVRLIMSKMQVATRSGVLGKLLSA